MAGPGGGPPRKSHTKSRNGCKTCKRRHIRCDETFPQCRNCTKHNCRCDYQDMAAPQGSPPASRRGPDLLMSPDIEIEIENWHRSGITPYPELVGCPPTSWSGLSRSDLRLIHHIVGLSIDLHRRGLSNCTIWAQMLPSSFLGLALSNDFVMSAILALSAFHLAFLTRDQETKQLALHHKATAFKGLRTALGYAIATPSKINSEAILAASILLSWQATEYPSWVSLQQGISTVLETMYPIWKQESEIAQFVENQRAQSASDYSMSFDEDLSQLDQTMHALQVAQKRVSHNGEHFQRLGELIDFVQQFRTDFPTLTSEQAFDRIQILRQWLFWLPPSLLRNGEPELNALAVLAQFFAVGMTLDRFYPDMGGAYLGALSIGPIEEMYRILAAHNATDPFSAELRLAISLMDLPRHAVSQYRNRLAWSPRPSIEHYSPGSASPYHALHDYSLPPSSSPASASPSYAAYTPPLQSPPAVTVAGSPFTLTDSYVTAAPSHTLYPPSPQLLDSHETQLGLSDLNQAGSIPHTSAFTPPYGSDVLCADLPRADSALGLNMEVYPPPHTFELSGLVVPETCWT
ncbi:hypothetical protein N7462_005979 [Penicillium macrosclerotiorum]|uniref:uncharacterized protein n=1 Tax=Penicillium macrosclerotiorum TaxID=303699 RepID=UPI0025486727|nr:uncharacterized protein N7462_005979 [Penicillium macrosclerotiorum]KAJ5682814.1 hypothetical protein N7462_005979 [Penicillium macrosclerotiorum]